MLSDTLIAGETVDLSSGILLQSILTCSLLSTLESSVTVHVRVTPVPAYRVLVLLTVTAGWGTKRRGIKET